MMPSNQLSHITDSISVHSSSVEEPEYFGFDVAADKEVQQLARQLTQQSNNNLTTINDGLQETSSNKLIRTLTSMSQVPGVSPFTENEVDERLNPDSDNFDSKFWIKNLKKLYESNPDHYKPTSLGVSYRNLTVEGVASDADFQPTVLNIPYKTLRDYYYKFFESNNESRYFQILKPMDAIMKPGELTVVLTPPSGGASTLLKTLSQNNWGLKVGKGSQISYDGLTPKEIVNHYRGEVVYSAETEAHIPTLTVGQTLEFAAELRTPQNRPIGVSREDYAKHMAKVYMATYGLTHTYNTKVGNEFIRGISGGEKKRVSLAEVSLCGSNVQCWDNATRGLDAATALEFVRAVKTSAMILDTTPLIAIYQCSQDAYDLFDNVVLLYEGYQIYYGKATEARLYFERMGWECPARQTTADFLTSLTSPAERVTKPGWETKVPRTPKEFSDIWRNSKEYNELIRKIDDHIANAEKWNMRDGYQAAHVAKQSRHINPGSSYTVSFWMQIKILMKRNYWRTKGDPSITLFQSVGNIIMALILSSLFYNLSEDTGSFYYRTAAMFFALLFNGFSSMLEVLAIFESKDVVEKHKKFALYRPSADSFASIMSELPNKIVTTTIFNLIYYFMVNFKRTPGAFFYYYLMSFLILLVMSHMFRTVGSLFNTYAGSLTPTNLFLNALVIYAGFALPTPSMLGWSRWINYINPMAYAFEAVIANEFSGRKFKCSLFVPAYDDAPFANKVCTVVSSKAGEEYVYGTNYIAESFQYYDSHRWRNFGIVLVYVIFFFFVYIICSEFNTGAMQKGEVIVFQQSTLRKLKKQRILNSNKKQQDLESGANGEKPIGLLEASSDSSTSAVNEFVGVLDSSKEIFHWRDVCYEVQIKKETRRILDHVDGWVKPGTLTALMGASGAGKTTLLDVLANRVTMGIVSGKMFVNGNLRDASFQRSTGYVQQLDLHLETTTVREALRFSAYLRQHSDISKTEKEEYVEKVIKILDMAKYADAIVGIAGEGLNVEQRKRLTIGVEMAAKPALLLFLDEPTSGLDSQTAWSICKLIRKLADSGQAIMCTIHQPSAILMHEFDRLLFLGKGGRTVYFGDLGKNCDTLINYFESKGAHKCPPNANPAEWMLEVIGAAPGSHAIKDFHQVWLQSAERSQIREELVIMEEELAKIPRNTDTEALREFAAPLWIQFLVVTKRVMQQYWRTPTYIWSKVSLVALSSLFNGFTFFKAGSSLQGLQNQMLSIFLFMVTLMAYGQQYLPYFVSQRALYEVRERPSKTFSWKVFVATQIFSEIPSSIICGTLGFFCWYYPIGLQNNAAQTNSTAEKGGMSWLLIVSFFVYGMSLSQMCIAGMEHEQNAGNILALLFSMSLNFCGVMYYPTGFWSFMYRANPATYFVSSIFSAGISDSSIACAPKEFVTFSPPSGETCEGYMAPYVSEAGGYLGDQTTEDTCYFCSMNDTNVFLKSIHIDYRNRWRDYGIFLCFIAFDYFMFIFLYWLVRVPKKSDRVQDESALKSTALTDVDETPEEK